MRMRRGYIAREGWPFLAVAIGLGAAVHHFFAPPWALPFWFAALVSAYMFRDPERRIPPSPLGVVSPVDGRIAEIAACADPYLGREALRIGLRMHWYGSFVVRSPIEGKVASQWTALSGAVGAGVVTEPAQAELRTTGRLAVCVRSDEDDAVVIEMILGRRLFRPSCELEIGGRIGQGQRCGMIQFGARINVYLPANARPEAKAGRSVRAGSRLIATLIHQ